MVTHPSMSVTFAQQYRDAVWESDLRPEHRISALAYADHDRMGSGLAWVTTTRLMARTGIRSRTTATRAVAALVESGWLVRVGPHERHPQIVVYRLTIPAADVAAHPAAQSRHRGSDGRFIPQEPVQQMDRFEPVTGPADGPVTGGEPVQQMDRNRSTSWTGTGPADGPDSQKDSQKDPQKGVARTGARTYARDPDGQLTLPIADSPKQPDQTPVLTGELVPADQPATMVLPSQQTAFGIVRDFTAYAAQHGVTLTRKVQGEYDTEVTKLLQEGCTERQVKDTLAWQIHRGNPVPRFLAGDLARASQEVARVRQPAAPVATTDAKVAATLAGMNPDLPIPKSIFDDMREAS